jgi:hypothetical protein
MITMDNNSYDINISTVKLEVKNIDAPAILNVDPTYKQTVATTENLADINISCSLDDLDDKNSTFEINATILPKNNDENCSNISDAKDGNITCSNLQPNTLYTVTINGSDGYLPSNSKTVTIDVKEGNVAPTLTVFKSSVVVDTMTSSTIGFAASDLNGFDTFDLNITSSDETIVKALVDKNSSKITLLAQPKVGTATISIFAQDDKNATSFTKTIKVTTKNKLASLVSTLKVVPPMDTNGTLLDNRYSISNFTASYSIAQNSIRIEADINDTNISSSLVSYPDEALYGGEDESNSSIGFVVSNGFNYEGQFKDGRVLVLSTKKDDGNASTPFVWGLATESEICKENKTDTELSIINSANKDTNITCNQ